MATGVGRVKKLREDEGVNDFPDGNIGFPKPIEHDEIIRREVVPNVDGIRMFALEVIKTLCIGERSSSRSRS